jgi:hypothetical protein
LLSQKRNEDKENFQEYPEGPFRAHSVHALLCVAKGHAFFVISYLPRDCGCKKGLDSAIRTRGFRSEREKEKERERECEREWERERER